MRAFSGTHVRFRQTLTKFNCNQLVYCLESSSSLRISVPQTIISENHMHSEIEAAIHLTINANVAI